MDRLRTPRLKESTCHHLVLLICYLSSLQFLLIDVQLLHLYQVLIRSDADVCDVYMPCNEQKTGKRLRNLHCQ